MTQFKQALLFTSVWILSPLMFLGVSGCGADATVISLANRDIAALTSDDIVRVMWRAGFSDEQIIEIGTDLRNCLASTGGAKILIGDKADLFLTIGENHGKKVEAMFSVDGDFLHGTSRRRGHFIYNLKTETFR
ncbi:MAG: hypothetical protein HN350_21995 [Phycisphaerales bacterium]|jgi:hypothetical protein|nr:hypothetical protein [Phycisphaerales bacterium]